jgi:microcin C transport system substrate-binding protein
MEKKIQSAFQLSCFYLILGLALAVFSMTTNISECRAAHGISIDGKLKYTPDFKQFDYTSDQAQKGGTLVLHDLGSYDKMNPFTLKGSAPSGLDNLVFETLAVSSLDEPFAGYGLIAKDI